MKCENVTLCLVTYFCEKELFYMKKKKEKMKKKRLA